MRQGPKGGKFLLDLVIQNDSSNKAWNLFKETFGPKVARGFEKYQDRFADGENVRVNITVFTDIIMDPPEENCECHGVPWEKCAARKNPN